MTAEQLKRMRLGKKLFFQNGGISPMKGKKHTEEAKQKQRIARLGKPGFWKGKKFDQQHLEKLSRVRKGIKPWNFTGKGQHYLRRLALIRDNYTCQICGLKDAEIMEVDHIKQKAIYKDLLTDIENLITLCPNCHRRKTIRNKELHKHLINDHRPE